MYESFEQAEKAAPRSKKIGYNHEELAKEYLANFNGGIYSTDYPILYHIDHILRGLPERCVVLDFGGNVGVHYISLKTYLDLERVKWIVCDVPAIAKAGREASVDMPNIKFIDDVEQFDERNIDILLASGSMQYLKSPDVLLSKLIAGGVRPQHILIDDVPVHDGSRFVTLQNGGIVCYAQYVFNRQIFIRAILNLGYRLVDSWHHNKQCVIPFHREKIIHCEGYYFVR